MEKELFAKMAQNISKISMRDDQDGDGEGIQFGASKGKKADEEENKIQEMQITDEDFVPLELFDGVLAEFQHKFNSKRQIQLDFIRLCREEAVKKQKVLGIDTERQKKLVDSAVFANLLNTKLEQTHSAVFTLHYKHSLLYYNLCGRKDNATDARTFKEKFDVCITADDIKNKYFIEWREKLNKEMSVFNGKIAMDKNDGETASTVSGATANTKGTA